MSDSTSAPSSTLPTVAELRGSLRRARTTASVALLVSAASFALHCQSSKASEIPRAETSDIIRARGLVIVDDAGVERIVLGAPTPDPSAGRRAAPLYGLVINAADGSERGGYGVIDADNSTILSLDDKDGGEVFKVAGNTNAGATIWVQHQSGSAAALTTYRGRPELHMIDADGATHTRLPADVPDLE